MDISEGNAGVRPSGSKAAPLSSSSSRFKVDKCRDPLGLWYVERIGVVRERRYFPYRHVARRAAKLLRSGQLDFDDDKQFEGFR